MLARDRFLPPRALTRRARWSGSLLVLALLATTPSVGAQAGGEPPRSVTVTELLRSIRLADKGALAVSEEDGRFLQLLVAATGARRVLEIGGASGYSAIWMGLGLRETRGELITIESDASRAREASANVAKAKLGDIVRVVAGDAFVEIPRLAGGFDLVFLDAWKPDYKKFFDLAFPKLRPGGLFLAHNVTNKKREMPDFLRAIAEHPQTLSTVVSPGSEGISMTYKKR